MMETQARVVEPYRPLRTDRRARPWLRAFAYRATSKWAVTPQRFAQGKLDDTGALVAR